MLMSLATVLLLRAPSRADAEDARGGLCRHGTGKRS